MSADKRDEIAELVAAVLAGVHCLSYDSQQAARNIIRAALDEARQQGEKETERIALQRNRAMDERDAAQAAEAKLARLRGALTRLHFSVFDPYDKTDGRLHFCNSCRRQWPCPTALAMRDEPDAKASESAAN